ncbi:MAG: hypothetical protein KKA67_09095 [Spirochaetes bacterium]|nr:hypothetical protein [Spirochaetota bacterium]MBU1080036.1 hypothetical protein [Spirochaetota bacterium]
MEWYVSWVSNNILLSAFIQFAALGTLGEVLGIVASKRKPSNKAFEWLAKAVVWGLLGVLVKYSFTGFKGFLAALVDKGFLPAACEDITILRALSLSVLTNSMFGPLLMVLHRTSDNLIAWTRGYKGIEKSLATLAWFWVPAHTVTFALPYEYQIGLAALWSVALGLIMGFTKRRS